MVVCRAAMVAVIWSSSQFSCSSGGPGRSSVVVLWQQRKKKPATSVGWERTASESPRQPLKSEGKSSNSARCFEVQVSYGIKASPSQGAAWMGELLSNGKEGARAAQRGMLKRLRSRSWFCKRYESTLYSCPKTLDHVEK